MEAGAVTFHAGGRYHGRFMSQRRTLHAEGKYHGWFRSQKRTFHAGGRYHGWFMPQKRTLHAERQDHGRFRDTATQILHMEATAGRQAGPFRSPAQSCRSVAAGGHIEATEKLYERHYLVIKIVSSFFACLIKFLYL